MFTVKFIFKNLSLIIDSKLKDFETFLFLSFFHTISDLSLNTLSLKAHKRVPILSQENLELLYFGL